MRKMIWPVLAGLAVNTLILAGLYLPGQPTHALLVVPVIIGIGSLLLALRAANDGRWIGRVPYERSWGLLRQLPVAARAGLIVIALAMLAANTLLPYPAAGADPLYDRHFAVVGFWFSVVASAMFWALEREREGGPIAPSKVSTRIFVAVLVTLGLIAVALGFLRQDGIFDETRLHQQLKADHKSSSWYPHLIAATTGHSAYLVYLDTRDPEIQAAACADLTPEAAKLGRRPDLYSVTTTTFGRKATFEHTC